MQRREARVNTTAARVKALLLFVQHRWGRAEADALLKSVRFDREYLEDETRPLPVEVWHAALVTFASRWGRGLLKELSPWCVHPENLGVWTRVLRGADGPLEAFGQLGRQGGEIEAESWQTLTSRPGYWHGRLVVHQPSPEDADGLCSLARAAELAAVPLLFGLAQGRVERLSTQAQRDGSLAEEFVVRFRVPKPQALLLPAFAGVLAAGALLVTTGRWWLAVPLLLSCLALIGWGYERQRRAQASLQKSRIAALERAAALSDARERDALGFREGSIIAGQYRLGLKLGVGASGTVWEAQRLSDGNKVAVKLLRAAVAHDTVSADRLRREAQALGLAWHPNVVEVYDDGVLPDGTSYLVMQRLYGETLATRLKRRGTLTPPEVLPLALQVCDALEAVHATGIIHRDLKPTNIFLAVDSGNDEEDPARRSLTKLPTHERVKLLDFGVARVEWAETRLTNMEGPLGTPGYMSPEQELGGEVDARSDLYAVGGVIYECLCGRPPSVSSSGDWEALGSGATLTSAARIDTQALPEAWRALITQALAHRPSDRFADARAMKQALLALKTSQADALKEGSGG